jgi:hypothetical protein
MAAKREREREKTIVETEHALAFRAGTILFVRRHDQNPG